MKPTTAAVLLVAAVIAGCGSSNKIDANVSEAELALNASPEEAQTQAVAPEDAALAAADQGVEELDKEVGGTWTARPTPCEPSGPIESCGIRVTGKSDKPDAKDVVCTTRAAVRVLDSGTATVKRVAYICKLA